MGELNFDKTPTRSERIKERNKEILESFKKKDKEELDKQIIKEHTNFVNNKDMDETFAIYNKGKVLKEAKEKKINDFSTKLKQSLLISALETTFDKVAEAHKYNTHELNIGHSMLENFVNEMGVENLLHSFGKKNLILSEYSALINETFRTIVDEAAAKDNDTDDVDDDSTYIPDKAEGKKFIDNIMSCTPGRVPVMIQDRVEKSVKDFVDQNVKNKEAIKDIYSKAKNQVEKPGNEKYQEEINLRAKKDVHNIYESDTNLLGMMVRLNSESIIKNDNLKKHYLAEDGKLDYQSILKDTVVMYTVLETVNTLGLVDPNKELITKILNDLK